MGSLSPYDFEAFYHSICADLQTRGEVHSMSKQFSLMEDDNERYCFILGGGVFFKILPRNDLKRYRGVHFPEKKISLPPL